jgi:arylsulfatase A-like enzyme
MTSPLQLLVLACAIGLPVLASAATPELPNIIVMLADDAGYGDVSLYGGGFRTPNIEALAARGMTFTQAYAPAATCTPTRYALLTGEYPWRAEGTDRLDGDTALIIRPGRTTIASLLREAGYATAVIGKWHLGLGEDKVDWNGEIRPGPLETGFDYFFGIAATGDRVPTVYIENYRVVGLEPSDPIVVDYRKNVGNRPTFGGDPDKATMKSIEGHTGTIINGIGRVGYMAGGEAALWKDDTLSDTLRARAIDFIEQNSTRPFFLYYAMHEPHAPHVPAARFAGRSGRGPRLDAMLQLDDAVGEVLRTLDRLGIGERTLIVFTSDNGPAQRHGYDDGSYEAETRAGHDAAGGLRGQKSSYFEGGVRVPMVVAWPQRIRAGTRSAAVVCTVDFLATIAEVVARPLGPTDGADSLSFLPVLEGRASQARESVVLEGGRGAGPQAIRAGQWKLVVRPFEWFGRWRWASVLGLYDLEADPAETRNVASDNPQVVARLKSTLLAQWSAGATRPGATGRRD